MNTSSVLFDPLTIGKLELAGRLYKSATAETRADEEGFVTDELLEFYAPMAWAGTPLIITGNLFVSRLGKSTHRMAGVDSDEKVPGLARLADLVRGHGSRIVGQLNHCGRQVLAKTMKIDQAVSASNVREKLMGTKPRPLTLAEIRQTVRDFADAAGRCQRAGFDGVQIHAAHGYLINQFLTPYTNRRRDEYGGSFANRLRFLREVHAAVRERVGRDYPILLKLNGDDALPGREGLRTSDLIEIARIMEQEGVDAIEISVGHYESGPAMLRGEFEPFFRGLLQEGLGSQLGFFRRTGMKYSKGLLAKYFASKWPFYEGFNLDYAQQFKKSLRIPVICVGGFHTKEKMEEALSEGLCDAVSCARGLIADPLLYRHLRDGRKGPVCTFCNGCIARAGSLPADCYEDEVRAEKDALLAEIGWERLLHPAREGARAAL